jgi:protocatechuate 3,4-dioxygenase beta subunit
MRRILVLVVVLLAVAGCDGTAPATPPGTSPSSSEQTTAGASGMCAVPAPGSVDAASVLVPGPVNGLPASSAGGGEKLTFVATVLDLGCQSVAGATVRVWHTDAAGLYGPGTGTDECCYFGGTVTTDANGRFRLDTIRPAQYPQAGAPPAHIHFEMRHDVGRLDTEIVFFTGTPAPNQAGAGHVVPVDLTRSGDGWSGATAFVLSP